MIYDLFVEPEAEKDILEAAIWYEGRRAGLGNGFLLAVEASLEAIKRNPGRYLVKFRNIQRALMKRFPYAIYFLVEKQTVFILAIIHQKRNPAYHESRTDER